MQHKEAGAEALGTQPQLRSQRALASAARRKLVQACNEEYIALEARDDADGFQFWVARVKAEAFLHNGPNQQAAAPVVSPARRVDGASQS